MVASAATLGPAANEMFSRKGAVQEVATHDRLYNRYITASDSLCRRSASWPLSSATWTTQAWSML